MSDTSDLTCSVCKETGGLVGVRSDGEYYCLFCDNLVEAAAFEKTDAVIEAALKIKELQNNK